MTKNVYYIYGEMARLAVAAMDSKSKGAELSVDLNRSSGRFEIQDDRLILDQANSLSRTELKRIIKKDRKIFVMEDGELSTLETRGHDYYKLVPTSTAPVLEISGVKMHISKDICPFESAGKMADQVVRPGYRVLDTCSGLGYAASRALELGAREVVSVELSPNVMALRLKNPWSQRIFGPGATLVNANIDEYIRELETASFDAVIHDPPRFSLAGELYGEEFYREIHRVLKAKGALFHYTGNPHLIKRGNGFMENVAKRLRSAGFKKIKPNPGLMGMSALK